MIGIPLPVNSSIRTIRDFLATTRLFDQPLEKDFELQPQGTNCWMAPVALAAFSSWGRELRDHGGSVAYTGEISPSIRYAIRMGLFDALGITAPPLEEHEEAGRFIPVRNIRTPDDQERFLTDLQPMLHLARRNTWAIQLSMSELIRNVLEHSRSKNGAFACAQYHPQKEYVSIGVADAGIGVKQALSTKFETEDDEEALLLALRPGVSGAMAPMGHPAENAGLGLFVTKSIARIGRQEFCIASGTGYYKMNRPKQVTISPDPRTDGHRTSSELPHWQGTIVGVNISTNRNTNYRDFFARIRHAMPSARKREDYSSKVRFS